MYTFDGLEGETNIENKRHAKELTPTDGRKQDRRKQDRRLQGCSVTSPPVVIQARLSLSRYVFVLSGGGSLGGRSPAVHEVFKSGFISKIGVTRRTHPDDTSLS